MMLTAYFPKENCSTKHPQACKEIRIIHYTYTITQQWRQNELNHLGAKVRARCVSLMSEPIN